MYDALEKYWGCRFSFEGLKLVSYVYAFDSPSIGVIFHNAPPPFFLKLDEELRRDGRFRDLKWRAYDGLNTGKETFDLPVAGELPTVQEGRSESQKNPGWLARLLSSLRSSRDAR